MAHVDIVNSASQVVTILTGIAFAVGYVSRRSKAWVKSIDERFDAQATETEKRFDAQAAETEKVREEAASTRTEVAARLDEIEKQLRPNGGSTHHDLMAAASAAAARDAVREAVREMADVERARSHRRRW